MSLETADWVRAIERGLHLAASFSVFGAILFHTVLARPVIRHLSDDAAKRFDRACAALVWFSAEVAVFAAAAWLLMQSAYMSLSETAGRHVRSHSRGALRNGIRPPSAVPLAAAGSGGCGFQNEPAWSLGRGGTPSGGCQRGPSCRIGTRSGNGRRVRNPADHGSGAASDGGWCVARQSGTAGPVAAGCPAGSDRVWRSAGSHRSVSPAL